MPDFLRAIGSTHNRVGGVIVDQEPAVQAWPDTMPDHYHDIDKRSLLFTTDCLLYTSPSPRDRTRSRMPSSA